MISHKKWNQLQSTSSSFRLSKTYSTTTGWVGMWSKYNMNVIWKSVSFIFIALVCANCVHSTLCRSLWYYIIYSRCAKMHTTHRHTFCMNAFLPLLLRWSTPKHYHTHTHLYIVCISLYRLCIGECGVGGCKGGMSVFLTMRERKMANSEFSKVKLFDFIDKQHALSRREVKGCAW